jgi:hypothetical protein
MSRVTTIITGPDGKSTTVVTRRSGCGCLTALAVVFVLAAPAYYAGQGDWPLGWTGAALAYVVVAAVLVGGLVAAVNRVQARSRRKSP